MSQFALSSSDHPLIPSTPSTQDNETEPSLSYFIDDVSALSVEESVIETQSNPDSSDTSMRPQRSLSGTLLAQAQKISNR